MPHAQECQGEGWYDDASWTWGDYFDDLSYISYDIQYESKFNSIARG